MAPPKISRRKAPKRTEKELYKAPNIKKFIENERRQDELARLREVKVQKKVWNMTVFICLLLNCVLLGCAYFGWRWEIFS